MSNFANNYADLYEEAFEKVSDLKRIISAMDRVIGDEIASLGEENDQFGIIDRNLVMHDYFNDFCVALDYLDNEVMHHVRHERNVHGYHVFKQDLSYVFEGDSVCLNSPELVLSVRDERQASFAKRLVESKHPDSYVFVTHEEKIF